MDIRALSAELPVAPQILPADLQAARAAGLLGMPCRDLPAESGQVSEEPGAASGALMAELPRPVLADCRTGMRSTTMWALSQATQMPLAQSIERASRAGFELQGVVRRIVNGGKTPVKVADATHEVVIVGGGAAGISVAARLLARCPGRDIAITDPADIHDDQPGWTLVGAGVFNAATTARSMASVLPRGVHGIKSAVAAFEPERDAVVLDGCRVVKYRQLVLCPGLKLDWHGIAGLAETLGRNGGSKTLVTREFDMLHAVPPQQAPDFIRVSPLADAAGWIDVDAATLRHKQFANIFALGDAANAPNAKTAAAARKQAPVVAHNLLVTRGAAQAEARHDGDGACPLTVARGRIVLAEFADGGKLAPSFPTWLIDGTRPSALAWSLKERIMPPLYREGMRKGREWRAQPEMVA